ncbi:MAG: hypothetical protein AVDCRST_MAG73-2872 [uncultured Thermomicrobiales bacterium]|uniref:Trypsin-co-occurring domain-containing protein n=1 Tax=uncultured Thermomicrobiales bacterium TaxID=1645740 RepID=A0A6J4UML9_9BACT|nr:MAG: hypothetical protein AVDCRST_MAG73-2872 [uncultured Thermomicrobiales bacterium]
MKHLIAFPTDDGGTVVVEVEEEPAPGMVRAARPGEVAERAGQTFAAALDTVRLAAETIVAKLGALSEQPNETTVQFGIKLSAQAGALIASTDAEANFAVTLKWTRSA